MEAVAQGVDVCRAEVPIVYILKKMTSGVGKLGRLRAVLERAYRLHTRLDRVDLARQE